MTQQIFMAGVDSIKPAFATNNVPVFFGCDDNYFPHAATLIASIMAHASKENNYDFLLFMDGVPKTRLAAAGEWMKGFKNASLRFLDASGLVDREGVKTFPATAALTMATYFRLFGPEALANYAKAVYLDVDIVCLDDVARLHNEDVEGFLAGACEDAVALRQSLVNPDYGRYWQDKLGLPPGSFYFNAGVMLMNLAAIRSEGVIGKALDILRTVPELTLLDQDALNSAMFRRVKVLPGRWNCIDLTPVKAAWLDEDALRRVDLPRDEIGCLHYTEKKPWAYNYAGRNADLYWKYSMLTPFCKDAWGRLEKECGGARSLYLNGKWLLQTMNNSFRMRLKGKSKRGKYSGRLRNLRMLRTNALRHMANVRRKKYLKPPF